VKAHQYVDHRDGTGHRARAVIKNAGRGANLIEDSIYATAFTDANGKPFPSDRATVKKIQRTQSRKE